MDRTRCLRLFNVYFPQYFLNLYLNTDGKQDTRPNHLYKKAFAAIL